MHPVTFHLLPNAHLDPVWWWDWREGLNEGIITCRTVLDLMDEFPDLTFVRGEALVARAETTASAVAAGLATPVAREAAKTLKTVWHDLTLGEVAPNAMATWHLTSTPGGWQTTRVNAAEEAIT